MYSSTCISELALFCEPIKDVRQQRRGQQRGERKANSRAGSFKQVRFYFTNSTKKCILTAIVTYYSENTARPSGLLIFVILLCLALILFAIKQLLFMLIAANTDPSIRYSAKLFLKKMPYFIAMFVNFKGMASLIAVSSDYPVYAASVTRIFDQKW